MDGNSMVCVPRRFLVVFILLHLGFLGILLLGEGAWQHNLMVDTVVYMGYINGIVDGGLPYVDYPINDYPPMFVYYLGGYSILMILGLVPDSLTIFIIVNGLVNLVYTLIGFYIIRSLAIEYGYKFNPWYYLVCFSSYVFFAVRYEPIVMMLSIIAVYFYIKGEMYTSSFFAASAISFKWYFGLFIVAVLLTHRRRWKQFIVYTGIIYFIFNAFFILFTFDNFLHPLVYHSNREPIIDGIYSALGYFGLKLPHDIIFPIIMLCGAFLLYVKRFDVLRTYILLVLLFLLTSKVYSPQYNLWIVFFLLLYKNMLIYVALWELIDIIIFPFMYHYVYSDYVWFYMLLVIIRHILLLILFVNIYNNTNKDE